MIIEGKILDIFRRRIIKGRITIDNSKIKRIDEIDKVPDLYILPGLIDAHIHIESSMVTPSSFAVAAVSRGTTAVVSDPHEIANVMGIEGVRFMIDNASLVPLKFYFGAPSCVPATSFESSGAVLDSISVGKLLEMPEIKFLAEMMNFPGVIFNDSQVHKKLEIARKLKKPIDGHAPGLSGDQLEKYISSGISTDHECTTINEAREKISHGMKILIREGSAAKNLEELKELYRTSPEMIMLCSDDLHPEMLMKGHINKLVGRLISDGYDIFNVIRSCTLIPSQHYGLETGLLKPGDPADFIITESLEEMNVTETWINGQKVFEKGKVFFKNPGTETINHFNSAKIRSENLKVISNGSKLRVIEAFDGSLITKEIELDIAKGELIEPDIKTDTLKIVVKDRYKDLPPAIGFIKGFGLNKGAFASSVAHDSHNIICIGTNDNDIALAINEIVNMKGGLAVVMDQKTYTLPLPVAGIISDLPVEKVARLYEILSKRVKSMGCKMSAPFMTLSFMALLVIPQLKLSDRGLFDGTKFSHVPLFYE